MLPGSRCISGIVSASTTRIHCVHRIAAKYLAACCISSSVIAFASAIIVGVFDLRRIGRVPETIPEVAQLLEGVADGLAGGRPVLRTPFAVRQMTRGATRPRSAIRLAGPFFMTGVITGWSPGNQSITL